MRLLDEMGSLAEGDLTVKATVTEDITGAIADSINFAIEALRSLVSTINETAVQVAAAAQETQATAMHLAEAAEHQAQQINSASAQIKDVATSIDQVSRNSAESADVAHRSVEIAAKGAEVVRQTIQGMDNIRDQIQETSKRIKRLGESSQEIGSIVELINDIAEQTNILALNAAIQAASAGEAGRGFAVVADEVQRLAERASNATKRIETLVQTIQSDTNEAVSVDGTDDRGSGGRCPTGRGRRPGAGRDRKGLERPGRPHSEHFDGSAPAVRGGNQHHRNHVGDSGDHHADLARRQPDRRVDRKPRSARRRPSSIGG